MYDRKTRRIDGRITERQFEALETIAQAQEVKVSEVIRALIDQAIIDLDLWWLREEAEDGKSSLDGVE